MKILSIESSGHVASVALMEDGRLLGEFSLNCGLTHSQTLMPMLSHMMELCGADTAEIDAVAVSAGPGSFTGLRIGAATAKGLAMGIDCPLIAVSTLEALAYNVVNACGAYVCPIMDARRGQVYCAVFRNGERLIAEKAGSMEELIDELNGFTEGNRCLFLGDGVPVYRSLIAERLTKDYTFVTAENSLQRGASVAQLGYLDYSAWLSENGLEAEEVKRVGASGIGCFDDRVMNSDDFSPSYIRKPQAQREMEAGLLEDPGLHSLKKMSGAVHGKRQHKDRQG